MQVVIDIPEEDYRKICKRQEDAIIAHDTCRRIAHGTVLPKGHGKLVDLSYYEDNYFNTRIQYDDGDRIRTVFLVDIPAVVEPDYENTN